MNLTHEEAVETGRLVLDSLVAQCLALLGDRLTLLVIRDLFLGRHRFEDFLQHTGAVRSTLANRLKVLVAQGIVYRHPYQTKPLRHEYRLTPKGLGLYDFALSIWAWEQKWVNASTITLPPRLVHRTCASAFYPVCACARCHQAITVQSLSYVRTRAHNALPRRTPASKRRSKASQVSSPGKDASLFHTIDALGDRWNNLILGGALYGLRRYDDFQRGLGISTNILADRLKWLVSAELMERIAYQSAPQRYQYRLTQKGQDYLPIAMSLHKWSERWWLPSEGGNVILRHRCSPEPLQVSTRCSVCDQAVAPKDVTQQPPRPDSLTIAS